MRKACVRGAVVAAVACSLAAAQVPAAVVADEPGVPDEQPTQRTVGTWTGLPSLDALSFEKPDWADGEYLSTLREKAAAAGEELRAAGEEIRAAGQEALEAGREYLEGLVAQGGGDGDRNAGDADVAGDADAPDGGSATAGDPAGNSGDGGAAPAPSAPSAQPDAPAAPGSPAASDPAEQNDPSDPEKAPQTDAERTTAEDGRTVSVLVLNEGVSIAYGDEFALDAELAKALVASLTDAKTGEPIDGADRIILSYVHAVGTQDVTVTYTGDADHAPATATAKVEIVPGNASIAVNSQSVAYGEEVGAVVTAGPDNAKPVTVIVGVDTCGQPFVGADFPDVTIGDLMGEDESVLGGVTLQGLMVMMVGPDFSLGAIESNLDTIGQMLAFAGIEDADELVGSLQQVIDVAREISPDLLDVSVKLGGTPTEAGLYTVVAFTANKNYDTAFDMGYIAVKQQYEDIALEFAQQMDDGARLALDDAAAFDYGVTVHDADGTPIDGAKLVVSFDGIAYDGSLYHSSEAPQKAGAYAQTAYILGGNYYASPIARSYTVERYGTELTIDGAAGGAVTAAYDGEPQGVSATLACDDGTVVEDAQVELTYYRGTAENGDLFVSTTPPTDAGTYRVTAVFLGDDRYEPAAAEARLIVEKAQVRIDISGAYHTTYGDPVDHDAMAATFSIDAHGAPIPEEALAVLRAYLACSCDGEAPHAGTYAVELEDGYYKDENSLFKQVVIDSGNFAGPEVAWECQHVVDPCTLMLQVDDASKTEGDADPAYTYTLVDGNGDALPNAAELLDVLGGVTVAREEGEQPGAYAITGATCANGDYELELCGSPTMTVEKKSVLPALPELPELPALPSAPVRPNIPQTADANDGGVSAAGALAVAGVGTLLASLLAFVRRARR